MSCQISNRAGGLYYDALDDFDLILFITAFRTFRICNSIKALPFLILAEKISVKNLEIAQAWNDGFTFNDSLAFSEFYNELQINVSIECPRVIINFPHAVV